MPTKRLYSCPDLDRLNQNIRRWREGKGFKTSWLNAPEKLMLVVTELSEAFEAYRDLTPSTLRVLDQPVLGGHFQPDLLSNFKEELADTYIRLGDLCASLGIDISVPIEQKMLVNEGRPHKHGRQR